MRLFSKKPADEPAKHDDECWCSSCGKRCNPQANFCEHCGTALHKGEAAIQSESTSRSTESSRLSAESRLGADNRAARPRNYYTEGEIILCTYAARYDPKDFGGKQVICTLTGRPRSSVEMKIRNIAAMLDDKGIYRSGNTSGLTGRTTGEAARNTNWDIVEPLARLTQEELLHRCQRLIAATENGPV